jgi:hypothetical protein
VRNHGPCKAMVSLPAGSRINVCKDVSAMEGLTRCQGYLLVLPQQPVTVEQ